MPVEADAITSIVQQLGWGQHCGDAYSYDALYLNPPPGSTSVRVQGQYVITGGGDNWLAVYQPSGAYDSAYDDPALQITRPPTGPYDVTISVDPSKQVRVTTYFDSCQTLQTVTWFGAFGIGISHSVDANLIIPPPPSNDNFANAITLTGDSGTLTGQSNAGATMEPGEPLISFGSDRHTIWYKWTATAPVSMQFDTLGSHDSFGGGLDSVIDVWTGSSVDNLTGIISNDDHGPSYVDPLGYRYTSAVSFNAIPETTYYLRVYGYSQSQQSNNIVINWKTSAWIVYPSNDNFVNATAITSPTGTITQDNVGATVEPTEPRPYSGRGANSVWFKVLVTEDGPCTINTWGSLEEDNVSLQDTVMDVFTGTTLSDLVRVVGNDDSNGGLNSAVNFTAVANTFYWIRVCGYESTNQGTLILNYSFPAVDPSLTTIMPPSFSGGGGGGGGGGGSLTPQVLTSQVDAVIEAQPQVVSNTRTTYIGDAINLLTPPNVQVNDLLVVIKNGDGNSFNAPPGWIEYNNFSASNDNIHYATMTTYTKRVTQSDIGGVTLFTRPAMGGGPSIINYLAVRHVYSLAHSDVANNAPVSTVVVPGFTAINGSHIIDSFSYATDTSVTAGGWNAVTNTIIANDISDYIAVLIYDIGILLGLFGERAPAQRMASNYTNVPSASATPTSSSTASVGQQLAFQPAPLNNSSTVYSYVDAYIRLDHSVIVQHDAVLWRGGIMQYQADCILTAHNTLSAAVDASIANRKPRTYSIDAVFKKRESLISRVDAMVPRRTRLTTSVDAQLTVSHNRYHFVDYLLLGTRLRHRVDSLLLSLPSVTGTITQEIDAYLALESVIIWWNKSYPYRHHISVTGSATAGRPVFPPINLHDLFTKGKTRSDYADVVVVHLNKQLTWTVVPSIISNDYLEFPLIDDLNDGEVDDGYYIFYGNSNLTDAPLLQLYRAQEWPDSALVSDPNVSFTRPGEHWINGLSSTPRAKATFVFRGDRVQLISSMGPNYGIANIQIDNGPMIPIDLYSAQASTSNVVYEIKGMSTGTHYIRVSVTGEKNPLSVGTAVDIQQFRFRNPIMVTDLGEESDILHWGGATSGS